MSYHEKQRYKARQASSPSPRLSHPPSGNGWRGGGRSNIYISGDVWRQIYEGLEAPRMMGPDEWTQGQGDTGTQGHKGTHYQLDAAVAPMVGVSQEAGHTIAKFMMSGCSCECVCVGVGKGVSISLSLSLSRSRSLALSLSRSLALALALSLPP